MGKYKYRIFGILGLVLLHVVLSYICFLLGSSWWTISVIVSEILISMVLTAFAVFCFLLILNNSPEI